jgi:hypothetical protein
MNDLSKFLMEARVDELHREARTRRDQAAIREAARPSPPVVTIRVGTPDDAPALKRLAALDSADVPAGPILVAEVGGELRAAVSLGDRAVVADPFHPTAPLVQLLLKRAEQVLGGDRTARLRRLRYAVSRRARRRRQTANTAPVPNFP